MKSIKRYILIFSLIGLVSLIGCEKDLTKINENPNLPTVAATPALLSQAIRDFGYNNWTTFNMGRQAALSCQHWSQRNYTSEDRYAYRSGTTDGFFRNNFIYMNNLQDIIRLNTDEATKASMLALYGDNDMQIACAEIVKAWAFQNLTDCFGDIPYSEALDFKNHPQPAYDTQKSIYDDLIAKMKSAQTALENSTTDGFASGDLFYRGDLTKWIKLANSLRLRLALRASSASPATAAAYLAEAQDAIADGVMESNDDNAQCSFSSVGAPNEAPIYSGFYVDGRNDFSVTRQFADLLKGLDDPNISFVNPYNGLTDPRWAVYKGPYYEGVSERNGVPYGMSDAQTKAYCAAAAGNKILSYSPAIPLASASVMLRPNFPSTFLDYPTVCFMASEVNNWDAVWFQDGMEASLEKWGADPTASAAYVTAVMTRFNAATTEQKKEMVITQKYIHLYFQPFEAWG